MAYLYREALRRQHLPCVHCGGEIDYAAQVGEAESFVVHEPDPVAMVPHGEPAHYACQARFLVAHPLSPTARAAVRG